MTFEEQFPELVEREKRPHTYTNEADYKYIFDGCSCGGPVANLEYASYVDIEAVQKYCLSKQRVKEALKKRWRERLMRNNYGDNMLTDIETIQRIMEYEIEDAANRELEELGL